MATCDSRVEQPNSRAVHLENSHHPLPSAEAVEAAAAGTTVVTGTPLGASAVFARPRGLDFRRSLCPRRNDEEDRLCYTPSLGSWFHGDMRTCAPTVALNCCLAEVNSQRLSAEFVSNCATCNFATAITQLGCYEMFRPDEGLQPCSIACIP